MDHVPDDYQQHHHHHHHQHDNTNPSNSTILNPNNSKHNHKDSLKPPSSSSCENNASSSSSSIKKRKRPFPPPKTTTTTTLEIISATYGPSDGRRLLQGTTVTKQQQQHSSSSSEEEEEQNSIQKLPHTRDVTPFLRMLVLPPFHHRSTTTTTTTTTTSDYYSKRLKYINNNSFKSEEEEEEEQEEKMMMTREIKDKVRIPMIMLGSSTSMNAMFGDPCLGTTKCLRVAYRFSDGGPAGLNDDDGDDDDDDLDGKEMEEDDDDEKKEEVGGEKKRRRRRRRRRGGEICKAVFAEHDQVILKRNLTYFQNDDDDNDDEEEEEEDENDTKQEKACSSSSSSSLITTTSITSTTNTFNNNNNVSPNNNNKKWRLKAGVSEIVLPMILPFLQVLQRAQCQVVCRAWRFVVRDRGVATIINVNDVSLFPSKIIQGLLAAEEEENNNSNDMNDENTMQTGEKKKEEKEEEEEDTSSSRRSYLRYIIQHSYSSLTSLILNDFHFLTEADLHPAVPHLRKLQTLDVSRCVQFSDSTLSLIGIHLSQTLTVLYIKGLKYASDEGVVSLCRSCRMLKVLDVSHIPSITDESGMAIGENLEQLVALYMRDNYLITDKSVDVIMKCCGKLNELVLWGCTRLHHLNFGDGGDESGGGGEEEEGEGGMMMRDVSGGGGSSSSSNGNLALIGNGGNNGGLFTRTSSTASLATTSSSAAAATTTTTTTTGGGAATTTNTNNTLACDKIVLLNLWGCYSLSLDAVSSMASLRNLRSLILSECHRLKDDFVVNLAQTLPHIHHLHLRYVRRITDVSVNAITNHMRSLYSLDLSFCTRITSAALANLLEIRADSLSELRLYSCTQLDVDGVPPPPSRPPSSSSSSERRRPFVGGVGRLFLGAIRSRSEDSILSILDMRDCGGYWRIDRIPDEVFEGGMMNLGFEQKIPGFFTRAARWNKGVERRMMEHLSANRRGMEGERGVYT